MLLIGRYLMNLYVKIHRNTNRNIFVVSNSKIFDILLYDNTTQKHTETTEKDTMINVFLYLQRPENKPR